MLRRGCSLLPIASPRPLFVWAPSLLSRRPRNNPRVDVAIAATVPLVNDLGPKREVRTHSATGRVCPSVDSTFLSMIETERDGTISMSSEGFWEAPHGRPLRRRLTNSPRASLRPADNRRRIGPRSPIRTRFRSRRAHLYPTASAARQNCIGRRSVPAVAGRSGSCPGDVNAVHRLLQFGRRDRIPSAVDPRTKLIDQAMVGQGLIKPEELVRIHEIGQQMDELRPDLVGAHVLAERAVQADREERERIKAEKKAAAEQQNAITPPALPPTNTMTSSTLAAAFPLVWRIGAAISRSCKRGLPLLATPADIAAALGIGIPKLRWLAYHAEASTVTHYVHLSSRKRAAENARSARRTSNGRGSTVDLRNIFCPLPAHDAAHGFVKDRSIMTNARPHVGSAVVINCDLTDFFPSIIVHRVIGVFRQIGYSPAVATILALLVTECPRRKVLYNGKPWHVATGPRVCRRAPAQARRCQISSPAEWIRALSGIAENSVSATRATRTI